MMISSYGLERLRRRAVGAGLAALSPLLVPASAAAHEPPPGLLPEGDWSHAEADWLVNQIEEAERVLPTTYPMTYDDGGAQLQEMGFRRFGLTVPGGYDHWAFPAGLDDGHFLNPAHAESLVYRWTGQEWELQAVMYMLHPDVSMEDLPPLISWIPGWHGHPDHCVDEVGVLSGITDPDDPVCPPPTQQAMTPLMTHVWIEDPGCGHRFGGIGLSGLHCDTEHEGHGQQESRSEHEHSEHEHSEEEND